MRNTREFYRAKHVRDTANTEIKRLNAVRTKYEEEMEDIRDGFYAFTKGYEEKKKALVNEVNILEEAKRIAEEPLNARQRELEKKGEELAR